jgi:hypothetical protein
MVTAALFLRNRLPQHESRYVVLYDDSEPEKPTMCFDKRLQDCIATAPLKQWQNQLDDNVFDAEMHIRFHISSCR